jgi:hypothetical protein
MERINVENEGREETEEENGCIRYRIGTEPRINLPMQAVGRLS